MAYQLKKIECLVNLNRREPAILLIEQLATQYPQLPAVQERDGGLLVQPHGRPRPLLGGLRQ